MKYRVYERDGQWLFESANNKGGNRQATYCESRESAERLLYLTNTWLHKKVRTCVHGELITASVAGAGILHDNGKLVDELYIRWNGKTYMWEAAMCEVVE